MTLFQSFKDFLVRKFPDISINIDQNTTSISFSYNSLNYRYVFYEDDPLYFRLFLPRVGVPNNCDIGKLCECACNLSAKYKVGKIIRIDEEFWIAFEQLILFPDSNNDQIYEMSIKVLSSMIIEFREFINNSQTTDH